MTPTDRADIDRILAMPSPENWLSPEEKLIWVLGDLMKAVENYFGAENPKRLGHIYCAVDRILKEVIDPIDGRAALAEIVAKAESGEWTLPSSFANYARTKLSP